MESINDEMQNIDLSTLDGMILRTNSELPNVQTAAFVHIRKLLAKNAASQDVSITELRKLAETINAHCQKPSSWRLSGYLLPILSQLIQYQDTQVLIETLHGITAVTENTTENLGVANHNIIQHLVPLLKHADEKVEHAALRAIGSLLTGDNDDTQLALDYGLLSHLDDILKHGDDKAKRDAVWCLSNIAAGTPSQSQAVVDHGFVPDIIAMLKSDKDIKKEASWVIFSLIGSEKLNIIQYLIDQNVVAALCYQLHTHDASTVRTDLECLRDLIHKFDLETNTNVVRSQIVEHGGLEKIKHLRNSESSTTRNEASEIYRNLIDAEESNAETAH